MSYSRVRERSEGLANRLVIRTQNAGNSSHDELYQGSYVGKEESMSDYVTPNYNKIVAGGGIVNNPCAYSSTKRGVQNGLFTSVWNIDPTKKYTYSGACCAWKMSEDLVGFLPGAKDNASEQVAMSRAIANIDSTPYEFGEDTFSIVETIKFLRNPLGSLYTLSKSFAKKRRRGASIAGAWATAQFAVAPIIRSTMDILEAQQRELGLKASTRRTARGFHSRNTKTQDVVNGGSPVEFHRMTTGEDKYRASILYEVSNPTHNTQFKYGLRAKDFPTTLWQLVPYSFVVDRVLDISTYIKGVVNLADPTITILAASVTRRQHTNQQVVCKFKSTGDWTRSGIVGPDYQDFYNYSREVWHPSILDAEPVLNVREMQDVALSALGLITKINSNFEWGPKWVETRNLSPKWR